MRASRSQVPYLRLKFERQRRGLTQQEVANRARLPQVKVSAIETGRLNPSAEELAALGEAFGIPPARLLETVRVQEDEAREIAEPSRG